MHRNSVCVRVSVILLLSCGVLPALAQQAVDQVKAIPCAGGGSACKTGFHSPNQPRRGRGSQLAIHRHFRLHRAYRAHGIDETDAHI
jgi:hypothetical protein